MELRELRKEKKVVQWGLTISTDIPQSKISLFENGYLSPTEKEKKIIATALGVSVDFINWPKPKKTADAK